MSQTTTHIDPLSTKCVLKYLGLAIDEIKLVRSIDNIAHLVNYNSAAHLESGRKHYLVSELRFLKNRLHTVREKANIN